MYVKSEQYDCVIAYGIGQYYEKIKETLKTKIKLDYLYDRKWDEEKTKMYDQIPIIRKQEFAALHHPLVIIVTENHWIGESIRADLKKIGFDGVMVNEILEKKSEITGKQLKEEYPEGKYEDASGNKIFFDITLDEHLIVSFQGKDNMLTIGKNVVTNRLYIRFGNHGSCTIGENTEIIGAEFYIAESDITIGKECLFSNQVILRTHDAHHIFDATTHKRINYARDIIIGDQVWIAFRVTLLGGAKIGTGSVVGTNSVTSGQFEDHQIIAGAPARVIKENICWSRENTEYFNRDSIEECISKTLLDYL